MTPPASNMDSIGVVSGVCVNELLSYLHFYVRNSNLDDIKIAILEFYNPEEITKAKGDMWNAYVKVYDDSCNLGVECANYGDLFKAARIVQSRKGSHAKPAHVMNIDDIVAMCQIGDENPPPVPIEFVAKNMDRLPRCVPAHIEMTSLARRMREMEVKLTETVLKVNDNTNELAITRGVQQQINERSGAQAAQINEIVESLKLPTAPATAYAGAAGAPVGHTRPGGKAARDPRTATPRVPPPSNHVTPGHDARDVSTLNGPSDTASVVDNHDRGDFSFQRHQRNPQRMRKKATFGTSSNTSGNLRGLQRSREVFVFNMASNTRVEDVKEYVATESNESGGTIDVIECRKVSRDGSRTNSFVIKVIDNDAQRLLNSSFWPENIGFRTFWPKRRVNSDESVGRIRRNSSDEE